MVFFKRATLHALKDGIAFRIMERLRVTEHCRLKQFCFEICGVGRGKQDVAHLDANILALVAVAQLLHDLHDEDVNALHIYTTGETTGLSRATCVPLSVFAV